MGLLSSKKKLKEQLSEQYRLQHEREEQFRAQQEEHLRREREWQTELFRREREEFQRRDLERQKLEQEQREQEDQRIRQEQNRMRQRERENQRLNRLRQTTPEALRRLRDLIRTRYQLDMYIWSLRGVKQADHEIVVEEGRKADAVLKEIYNIVDTWEESGWTPEDWRAARRIKDLLSMPGKRIWENNPPWHEV